MKLGFTFTSLHSMPGIDSLEEVLRNPRKLMAAQAKRLEIELRLWFKLKDAKGNKRGWRRTHFWSRRVRANTSVTNVTDTTGEVTIASPEFRLRLLGGVVRPIEAKYLALPAIDQASGRSPRTFGDQLRFAIDPEMGRVLEDKKTGAVFYFLRRKVTHKADPTALPPESLLQTALIHETAQLVKRERARFTRNPGAGRDAQGRFLTRN